jgi:hypothetical protein
MAFKKTNIERKCKWCDKPVKKYFNGKGEFKGYLKTCGGEKCLTMAYRDLNVRLKKRFNEARKCEKCGKEYIAECRTQRWCKICSPNKIASTLLQRYNISHPEYLEMLAINEQCPICLRKLDNPVIDHDHKTGKVRGMICNHCNVALNVIEDKAKLKRALDYLNIFYLTS